MSSVLSVNLPLRPRPPPTIRGPAIEKIPQAFALCGNPRFLKLIVDNEFHSLLQTRTWRVGLRAKNEVPIKETNELLR
jgi:hypothetical protein